MAHSVVAGGAFLALKQTPRHGAVVRVIGSGGRISLFPTADRTSLMRPPDLLRHKPAAVNSVTWMQKQKPRRGAELEEGILGIPNQQALALERSANTRGQPLDECLQLRRPWRCNASEHRLPGVRDVGPVEHQHVEVNAEIGHTELAMTRSAYR